MNQQRPADAQKYFQQALEADPKFAVARLNLGVALLGQQKLDAARSALTEATVELPNDPYGWYNLGLALKDSGEPEKGIAAFQRVTEIKPNEADAYYFIGYLSTQLQKYDDAVRAFQKGLKLNPVHASAEFGLARALQRKGDTEAAREHLARFGRAGAIRQHDQTGRREPPVELPELGRVGQRAEVDDRDVGLVFGEHGG